MSNDKEKEIEVEVTYEELSPDEHVEVFDMPEDGTYPMVIHKVLLGHGLDFEKKRDQDKYIWSIEVIAGPEKGKKFDKWTNLPFKDKKSGIRGRMGKRNHTYIFMKNLSGGKKPKSYHPQDYYGIRFVADIEDGNLNVFTVKAEATEEQKLADSIPLTGNEPAPQDDSAYII